MHVLGWVVLCCPQVGCTVAARADVVKNNQMIFSVNPPPEGDMGQMKGKTAVFLFGLFKNWSDERLQMN